MDPFQDPLSPDERAALEQIKRRDPSVLANQALTLAQAIVAAMGTLRQEIADGQTIELEKLEDVNNSIADAVGELKTLAAKPTPELDNSPVVKGIEQLQKQMAEAVRAISRIDTKPQVKADFKPNIQVSPTPVDVKVDAPDLSKLEKLLDKSLPGILTDLVAAIPQPEFDFSDVEKKLDKANETLKDILNRPIPVPTFPGVINVHLYGWYAEGSTWLPVLVDETGQLLGVGGGGGGVEEENQYGVAEYGSGVYA